MAKKKEGKKERDVLVDLTAPLALILANLDEALCEQVFHDVRTTERQRDWTFYFLARFWLAVVLEAPPALSHLLERTRTGDGTGLLPAVTATNGAFYQRCKALSPVFFEVLYQEFIDRISKEAPLAYCSKLARFQERFTSVQVIDGSRLDAIAHRLKILQKEKAVVLPGCLTAQYDLFRGIAVGLWFDADAAASEFKRAMLIAETLAPGTLLLGDRLYCTLQLFDLLTLKESFGVFRRARSIKLKKLKLLSKETLPTGACLEDWLVEASADGTQRTLRQIVLTHKGNRRSALTNALKPELLSARDIAELYPRRWQVERLFYDVKEVLNLHEFYAANPNAVAMQVFATAMLHAAFRVTQARIAKKASVVPERLSPAKLFPRLAVAAISLVEFEFCFRETQKANPRLKLKKPSPSVVRNGKVRLGALLVEPRNPKRRRRKFNKERAKWKSFKHVRGGRKLT